MVFRMGMIKVIKAGTLYFLSPEVGSGKEFSSTPKIDVWALGVILYFMLYNLLPFKGNNIKETINHIILKNPNYK